MAEAPAIGIDLGTTFSCAGVWRYGAVEIIENGQGKLTTPSVVSFGGNYRFIGKEALDDIISNSQNTVYDAKRMLGRSYRNKKVQDDRETWQFNVLEHDGLLKVEVTHEDQRKLFTPEEISAMVLTQMKLIVEKKLNKKVKDAVITVPAYFNDSQKQATLDAAEIAELNVLQLLSEPVAAGLAYGFDKQRQGKRNVLIFDLGGGTFDVSILVVNKCEFEVKTHGGNNHLGGEDFNNRMVKHLIVEFKRRHKIDVSQNKRAIAKLRKACEKAKCNLTFGNIANIDIDCLADDTSFKTSFTRAKFEDLNKDLFQSAINEVDATLKKVNMSKSSIEDVVLVGGSTRIPKIQDMLQAFFDGKDLYKSINPDEAVAYGAAVKAAMLGKSKFEELSGFSFIERTPLSLGVEVADGTFSVVIPRGTPIPAKKTEVYCTHFDNQTGMQFKVIEGERTMAIDNNLLGKFALYGLPALPREKADADLTYEVDGNMLLHMTAKDKSNSSNVVYSRLVYDTKRISKQEINRMIEESKKMQVQDEKRKKAAAARNDLEIYCADVESLRLSSFNADKRQKVSQKIEEVREWIEEEDYYEECEYISKKNELELLVKL